MPTECRNSQQFTYEDMALLVRRRTAVQKSILRLWSFGRKRLDRLQRAQVTLFHLLLGAVFSLWRAAFLVQGGRSRQELNRHAFEFLEVLSWDNAIGYPQDRAKRAWTAGYYLNNAYYRLRSLERRLELVRTQTRLGNHVPDAQAGWDDAHKAWEIAFEHLRTGK